MQIFTLASNRDDALRRMLPDLLGSAGQHGFEGYLFSAMREVSRCRHMNIFSYPDAGAPELHMAVDSGGRVGASGLAARYIAEYWRFDPLQRAMGTEAGLCGAVINDNDIDPPSYRKDCYESARLRQRLSLIARGGEEEVRLNLYSGSEGFSGQQLDALMGSADLLMASISRHVAAVRNSDPESQRNLIRDRLVQVAPSLSLREAEVCAGIVLGFGTEALSLICNTSKNTVQTYRKRAYRKMNISSQNELMRLVLR